MKDTRVVGSLWITLLGKDTIWKFSVAQGSALGAIKLLRMMFAAFLTPRFARKCSVSGPRVKNQGLSLWCRAAHMDKDMMSSRMCMERNRHAGKRDGNVIVPYMGQVGASKGATVGISSKYANLE